MFCASRGLRPGGAAPAIAGLSPGPGPPPGPDPWPGLPRDIAAEDIGLGCWGMEELLGPGPGPGLLLAPVIMAGWPGPGPMPGPMFMPCFMPGFIPPIIIGFMPGPGPGPAMPICWGIRILSPREFCARIMGPEGGICCMPALRGGPGSLMLLGPDPGPIPIWPPIM